MTGQRANSWATVKLPRRVIDRLDATRAELGCSRARALEALLDGSVAGSVEDPTHDEALVLLAGLARAGKVGAAVALERALRDPSAPEEDPPPNPLAELDSLAEGRAQQ